MNPLNQHEQEAFDAVTGGDVERLKAVLLRHPQVAVNDRILEESAGYNRPHITQMILDAGAVLYGNGEHYLEYAAAHGACDTADLFAALGATSNVYWIAAGCGFLESVQSHFDENKLRETAWQGRRNWEDFGMPERPLADGAEAVGVEGLIAAAMNNRVAVVDFLLASGLPINGEAAIGTPLHWAAYWNKPDMIEHLLASGADPAIRDDHWDATPLDWAKENDSQDAIERLAALGISD